uniref:C-type lectin domain-containing protein n=1 Tax=Plectus sambesii TaxID=2011161 RepID=A0A914VMG4_9BILA
MFEHILLLLLLPAFVFSATDLQTACNGIDRIYSGGSCLVLNKTAVKYSKAKVSCEHYLGYSGHLVFIRSVTVQNTLKQLITSNSVTGVYVGYEQTNATGLRNANWAYAYKNGSTITASFLPWKTGYPLTITSYDRAYFSASGVIDAAGESLTFAFVCEYEESLKQAVTDLEKQCAAVSQVHVYNNGHCYVWHDERVNYFAAKLSCQEIPEINGHVIHIRNAEQVQMVETILKAGSLRPFTWVGLEQTNVSAADTQQLGSWFYSTPQESDEMATFLPWHQGEPNNGATGQYADYSLNNHGLRDDPATAANGFICEYESSRPMTTDLERLCNSTGVDADLLNVATPDGHCYIMHTTMVFADVAKLSCNALPGYNGHLVHIRSESQIGIVESLMSANSFTAFAWVGMEHTNKSGNRSIGWYYTTPEDSNELASFLPWSSDRPSTYDNFNNVLYYVKDTGSGSSMNGIFDYPNNNNFKYICEYDCAVNSAWTAWSACSQSCDKGIRSRGVTYKIPSNCGSPTTPTPVYYYESCATGVQCK